MAAIALAGTPQSIVPPRTFRDGFGDSARAIREVAASLIVGVNLEYADPQPGHSDPLFILDEQAGRIREVKHSPLRFLADGGPH